MIYNTLGVETLHHKSIVEKYSDDSQELSTFMQVIPLRGDELIENSVFFFSCLIIEQSCAIKLFYLYQHNQKQSIFLVFLGASSQVQEWP